MAAIQTDQKDEIRLDVRNPKWGMTMTMSNENARSKAREDRMQTAVDLGNAKELDRHKRETLKSLVREQVMHTLGKPDDLVQVQVRPLWAANFRVNVFVGASAACARIVHSFFLVTDGEGNILESTPKIKRQGPKAAKSEAFDECSAQKP
jgi:hypothetical protein